MKQTYQFESKESINHKRFLIISQNYVYYFIIVKYIIIHIIRKKQIFVNYYNYKVYEVLPDLAFFIWVHRRPFWAAPILAELLLVFEGTIYTESKVFKF